jgi:NAD(P)H-dependent flavin oxidoreductase YrpB (nitropropane dioxygenase family)
LRGDIVVAQGAEAGGHGEKRATFTLVPEIADLITDKSPDTLLLAAGGIGDGRESELMAVADEEAAKDRKAWAEGDSEGSNTFVGEVAGLIRDIEPAADIIQRMVREAEARLASYAAHT